MKSKISATIIADSINPQGNRITTYELVFPRFILAELNTKKIILLLFLFLFISLNTFSQKLTVEVVSYGLDLNRLKTHKGIQLGTSHNFGVGINGYIIEFGGGYNDFTDIVSLGIQPINSGIYKGSQGGKYYINKNGNKTYIDRNTSTSQEAEVFDIKSSTYDSWSLGVFKKITYKNFIYGPYLGYNKISCDYTEYSKIPSNFSPTKSGIIVGIIGGYSIPISGGNYGSQDFLDIHLKLTNYSAGINITYKLKI